MTLKEVFFTAEYEEIGFAFFLFFPSAPPEPGALAASILSLFISVSDGLLLSYD